MLKKEGRLEAEGRGAFYASARLGNHERVKSVLSCE